MRIFFGMLFSLIASGVQGVETAYVDRWAASNQKVARPTVALRITWGETKDGKSVTRTGYGTAFLISKDGHYLTAGHLFPVGVDPSKILIEAESRPFQQNKAGPIRLKLVGDVQRTQLVDAAVLQTISGQIPAEPLYWSPITVQQTQQLLVVGYNGESTAVAKMPRVEGAGDDGTVMLDAFVQEGFSGSPVVDMDGLVVGMIRGGKPVAEYKDTGTTGFALFVPVSSISSRLPTMAGFSWPQAEVTPQPSAPSPNPAAAEAIAKGRELVFTSNEFDFPISFEGQKRVEDEKEGRVTASEGASVQRSIQIPRGEQASRAGVPVPVPVPTPARPREPSFPSMVPDLGVPGFSASTPAPNVPKRMRLTSINRVAVNNPIPIQLSKSVNVERSVVGQDSVDTPAVIVEALEGYRIKTASLDVYSESGATKAITIDPKGGFAALKFSLMGDPAKSADRGWLRGDFTVTMEPK